MRLALHDAAIPTERVEALYVGNMLSGILAQQKQLGSLIVDYAGLGGIEGVAIDAACAAGGAAIRLGYQHIASGLADVVVICGAEVMANAPNETVTRALATATDWQLEGSRGESFISLNATLMRAYMERHGVAPEAFAPFAINAHRNALANPNALLRKDVDLQRYLDSRVVAAPLRLFDVSPICNGAAAVVLANGEVARSAERANRPRVQLVASASFTDAPALSRRADPLRPHGGGKLHPRCAQAGRYRPRPGGLLRAARRLHHHVGAQPGGGRIRRARHRHQAGTGKNRSRPAVTCRFQRWVD